MIRLRGALAAAVTPFALPPAHSGALRTGAVSQYMGGRLILIFALLYTMAADR